MPAFGLVGKSGRFWGWPGGEFPPSHLPAVGKYLSLGLTTLLSRSDRLAPHWHSTKAYKNRSISVLVGVLVGVLVIISVGVG